MNLDDLMEEVGSFGRFQILMIFLVLMPKLGMSYNMLFMSYGALVPDWWCVQQNETIYNLTTTNESYKYCSASDDNSTCYRVYDNSFTTVVSEWNLVCDKHWITPTISSIQMFGVLIGAIITGQCADTIGRKKTYYSALLVHSIFSICIAFTTTWYIFTVMRFFIGMSLGAYLVVCMFLVEFIGFRYRPLLLVVPYWATGICFLSLSTWAFRHWASVHIAVGVYTIPFLLGWFIVPESVRWLAVKGHISKAEEVVNKIARINNRKKPANTTRILIRIYDEERKRSEGKKNYTYLDLYRGYHMAKHTITVHIIWWCLSASYYGFSFGIGRFSGDYYLNQFYSNVLEIPVCIPVILAMNRFGRRIVVVSCFILGTLCCVGVIIVQNTVEGYIRGTIITGLSLASRLFVGQAWAAMATLTSESYPTVIRNLGYGAANTLARVGGILAPFIFSLSHNEMVPYIIVTVIMGVSSVLSHFGLPETLDKALEDILPIQQNGKEKTTEVNTTDEMHSVLYEPNKTTSQ